MSVDSHSGIYFVLFGIVCLFDGCVSCQTEDLTGSLVGYSGIAAQYITVFNGFCGNVLTRNAFLTCVGQQQGSAQGIGQGGRLPDRRGSSLRR